MNATHVKRILTATTRQQLLRDLADFCEANAVDGPLTVDYDLASRLFMCTVFYLPGDGVGAGLFENVEARLLEDAVQGRR